MLDNLALDLTDSNVQSAMYSSTDNNYDTKTNASNTTLGYLFNGGGSNQYATSGISTTWTDSYTVPWINITNKNLVPQDDEDPLKNEALAGNWKVGGYYNYCAASAGSYCYDEYYGTGNATEDICPAGWRMPTGGDDDSSEFLALTTAITGSSDIALSGNDYTAIRNAIRLPLAGWYESPANIYLGKNASAFSSSEYEYDSMYTFATDQEYIYPASQTFRYSGHSVRCILKSD